ncbi:MAG: hypothetical protein WC489_05080 [Patescibacteria group bacterium]
MYINSGTGNVGIGSSTPTSFKMEVAGNIGPDENGTRDIGSSARYYNALYVNNIYGPSTGVQGFWQKNAGSLSPTILTDDINLGSIATASAIVHLPGLTNRDAFFNLGTGNLGVGTTSPVEKLDVTGNASVSGYLTIGQTGALRSQYGPLNLAYKSGLNTWTTGMVLQDGTGNIGIGTTNPIYKLDFINTQALQPTNNRFLSVTRNGATVDTSSATNTNYLSYFLNDTTRSSANYTHTNIAGYFSSQNSYNNISLQAPLGSTGGISSGTLNNTGLNISGGGGGSNTGGTINNYGIDVDQFGGSAGIGGTLNNYTISLTVPNGAGTSGTTNNYGVYIVGNGGASANNFSFYNSSTATSYYAGNVGIGTTSPLEKLDVTGNASVSGYLTIGQTGALRSQYGPLNLAYKSGLNTWTTGMVVQDGTGNVGIGTTNPSSLLEAVRNDTLVTAKFTQNGGWSGSNWALQAVGYTNLGGFRINGADGANSLYNGAAQMGFSVNDNFPITFGNFSTYPQSVVLRNGSIGLGGSSISTDGNFTNAKMVVQNGGNVGIGTTSPLYKLDIQGWASASGNLTTGGQFQLGRFGAEPSPALGAGSMYYNSLDNSIYYHNGSSWTQMMGGGGYWQRITGVLSPLADGDVIAATSGATTVATLTATDSNDAAWIGGVSNYAKISSNGDLTFIKSGSASTITGPTIGLTIDASTGPLGLGTSNDNKTISIGTGTGVDTIQIGNGATGADLITIGSNNAGAVTMRSGAALTLAGGNNSLINFVGFDVATTGNITVANTQGLDTNGAGGTLAIGNINAGTLQIGTSTNTTVIDIGTGAVASTLTLGNATGATALALNSGTGDITLTSTDQVKINSSKAAGGTTTEAFSVKSTADLGVTDEVFQVGDSAADFVTILGNGNTGIGTVSPLEVLDVVGNASVSAYLTIGQAGALRSQYGPLNLAYKSDLNTWTTGLVLQDGTGNVGIGTTNPTNKLHVNGNMTATNYYGTAAYFNTTWITDGLINVNKIRDYSGGYLQLQDDDGNVGIGTTTPASFKLEVAGNIGPDADGTRDLGSEARHFNNLYVNNIQPPTTGVMGFWQKNAGSLSPTILTDDINLGNIATASAIVHLPGLTDQDAFFNLGAGNFGIGTTTPFGKFNVTNQGAVAINKSLAVFDQWENQPILSASASGITKFLVDYAGNVGIGSISPLEKLDIAGSATISGNLTIANASAIRPTYGSLAFHYKSGLNTWSNAMTITNGLSAGGAIQPFIGIGTTAPYANWPNDTLAISGWFTADRFNDSANSDRYVDPSGTSRMSSLQLRYKIGFIDGSVPALTIGSIGMDSTETFVRIAGQSTDGATVDLCVDDSESDGENCDGKIDAGTIDPPYTINGKKYATYMPSMIGVKEETTGTMIPSQAQKTTGGYAYIVDFKNLPESSDLWIFSKITNLKENIDRMSVLLTPSDDTRTWYKIDKQNYALVIYSSRPTTISYRFTAPRFNDAKFTTIRPDNAPGGFLVNDPDIIGNPYTLTDSGSILETYRMATSPVQNNTPDGLRATVAQIIHKTNGEFIEEVGLYAKVLIGKITAGFIETENLLATNIAHINRAVVNQLSVTNAEFQKINTGILQATDAYIARLHVEEKIVSPVIETTTLKTNIIEPKEKDLVINLYKNQQAPTGEFAKFVIKGIDEKTVVSIDSAGNATFAGSLTAQSATLSGTLTASEASLSGKLIAKEIHADNIDELATNDQRLTTNVASHSSILSQLTTDNQQLTTNINSIQQDLANLKNLPLPNPEYYQTLSSDQDSATSDQLITLPTTNNQQLTTNDLLVTGTSNLYKASIADSLTVGNILVQDSSILSLSWDLRLSSLSTITLFDGSVVIAKNGNIATTGEVIAQSGLRTNEIQSVDDKSDIVIRLNSQLPISNDQRPSTNTKLKIENSLGDEVASIDASGSAKFNSLAFNMIATNSAYVADSGERTSANETIPAYQTNAEVAGTASLPRNTSEIIIYNTSVSTNSLIYLTPTGDTGGNQLTVVKKNSCLNPLTTNDQLPSTCRPYFSVSTNNPVHPEIGFNWLIIN